jgi:hypothetical protein
VEAPGELGYGPSSATTQEARKGAARGGTCDEHDDLACPWSNDSGKVNS